MSSQMTRFGRVRSAGASGCTTLSTHHQCSPTGKLSESPGSECVPRFHGVGKIGKIIDHVLDLSLQLSSLPRRSGQA